jgi:hypothetical protein
MYMLNICKIETSPSLQPPNVWAEAIFYALSAIHLLGILTIECWREKCILPLLPALRSTDGNKYAVIFYAFKSFSLVF